MMLLSSGGDNQFAGVAADAPLLVGTVDGVWRLERQGEEWRIGVHALRGCPVSALSRAANGTIYAATRGTGIARSDDDGRTWRWINTGLTDFDFWSLRTGTIGGEQRIFAGTMPAHLFVSSDGETWQECPALNGVASRSKWTFPPQPHQGHVKEIVVFNDRLFVGIEIGALLVSDDGGKSFSELPVHDDPSEIDIHRILVHPDRPDRLIVANGLLGLMESQDRGRSWQKLPEPPRMHYPDAIGLDPERPDTLIVSAAVGWPPHWYKTGRGQGKIAISHDAGRSWTRLFGGLPDGQRPIFSGLTAGTAGGALRLYAGDTDGQIYESRDGGEHWSVIADIAPVSKGDFHKALAKGRPPLADLDDMAFNAAATKRLADAKLD